MRMSCCIFNASACPCGLHSPSLNQGKYWPSHASSAGEMRMLTYAQTVDTTAMKSANAAPNRALRRLTVTRLSAVRSSSARKIPSTLLRYSASSNTRAILSSLRSLASSSAVLFVWSTRSKASAPQSTRNAHIAVSFMFTAVCSGITPLKAALGFVPPLNAAPSSSYLKGTFFFRLTAWGWGWGKQTTSVRGATQNGAANGVPNPNQNQTPKFPSMRKRVLHPPDLGIHQTHDQISPCTILVGPFFFPPWGSRSEVGVLTFGGVELFHCCWQWRPSVGEDGGAVGLR